MLCSGEAQVLGCVAVVVVIIIVVILLQKHLGKKPNGKNKNCGKIKSGNGLLG